MMFRGQQLGRWHEQRPERRRIRRNRIFLAIIIFLLFIAAIVVEILSIHDPKLIPWVSIAILVLTGLGVLFTSLQYLLPNESNTADQSDIITPHGIVRQGPAVESEIVKREKTVIEVYDMFSDAQITAIVMRGINGIGKSTLANLIYHYTEKQRSLGKGPFIDQALWIRIEGTVTFAKLAKDLFIAFGIQPPNFSSLMPQFQAQQLYELLAASSARLIVLDFEYPFDRHTGLALTDDPSFKEWLMMLNNGSFSSIVLLTDCPWAQGTSKYALNSIKEYQVGGLDEIEGMELLQNYEIKATDDELRSVVRCCDGHAGALAILIRVLTDYHLSLTGFLDEQAFIHLWIGEVAREFFDYFYQQLDAVQHELLIVLSVYRKPVPIDAVLDVITNFSKVEVLKAIPKLTRQHLLKDLKKDDVYQLHTIVANYIYTILQANQADLQARHINAAKYYLDVVDKHLSAGQQKTSKDIQLLIEATCHKFRGGEHHEAYQLMQSHDLLRYVFDQRNTVL